MVNIKRKVLEKIDTPIIVSELVRVTGKSYNTIRRWISNNDRQLTQFECLEVIKKETGMNETDIFGH